MYNAPPFTIQQDLSDFLQIISSNQNPSTKVRILERKTRKANERKENL